MFRNLIFRLETFIPWVIHLISLQFSYKLYLMEKLFQNNTKIYSKNIVSSVYIIMYKNFKSFNWARSSWQFIGPKGSLLCLQEPATE
jgi:hypothetical protein